MDWILDSWFPFCKLILYSNLVMYVVHTGLQPRLHRPKDQIYSTFYAGWVLGIHECQHRKYPYRNCLRNLWSCILRFHQILISNDGINLVWYSQSFVAHGLIRDDKHPFIIDKHPCTKGSGHFDCFLSFRRKKL